VADHDDGLPIAADVRARAVHGSFCPKMCSHACPVLAATGRADAVPWSFHRTVADLAEGRLAAGDAAARLVACTGCGACGSACVYDDQDVPAQVRAGRAAVHAAGAAPAAVAEAETAVAAGRSPYPGHDVPRPLGATAPTVQLVVGCRDGAALVAAAVRVLGAAGEAAAVVVPTGCCGGTLTDLGATDAAAAAAAGLAPRLRGDVPVVLLDPHCRSAVTDLAPDVPVEDLVAVLGRLVADGDLQLDGAPESVRWHEPCLLVDGPAAGLGPRVLAAVGALVELPGEAHRGCSGAGLGLELLDEGAASEVAAHRRRQLAGPGPVVTACAGAAARLGSDDVPARHLVEVLDDLLTDDPESVA
jgi:Fe-S oxidoreductase